MMKTGALLLLAIGALLVQTTTAETAVGASIGNFTNRPIPAIPAQLSIPFIPCGGPDNRTCPKLHRCVRNLNGIPCKPSDPECYGHCEKIEHQICNPNLIGTDQIQQQCTPAEPVCIDNPKCDPLTQKDCRGICVAKCRSKSIPCEHGLICMDIDDTCDPSDPDLDCPGLCVHPTTIPPPPPLYPDVEGCGGHADTLVCAKDSHCVHPDDKPCDPNKQKHCHGRCVQAVHPPCKFGQKDQCKNTGTDETQCIKDPKCDHTKGKKCPGICVAPCDGIQGLQCKNGLECDRSGIPVNCADCTGVCVHPSVVGHPKPLTGCSALPHRKFIDLSNLGKKFKHVKVHGGKPTLVQVPPNCKPLVIVAKPLDKKKAVLAPQLLKDGDKRPSVNVSLIALRNLENGTCATIDGSQRYVQTRRGTKRTEYDPLLNKLYLLDAQTAVVDSFFDVFFEIEVAQNEAAHLKFKCRGREPNGQTCGGKGDVECPHGSHCVPDHLCDSTTNPHCHGRCVAPEECVGIGSACAANHVCVENPKDMCDDPNDLDNCVGICAPQCAGFANFQCPTGLECVDIPDTCDPMNGGAGCPGACLHPSH